MKGGQFISDISMQTWVCMCIFLRVTVCLSGLLKLARYAPFTLRGPPTHAVQWAVGGMPVTCYCSEAMAAVRRQRRRLLVSSQRPDMKVDWLEICYIIAAFLKDSPLLRKSMLLEKVMYLAFNAFGKNKMYLPICLCFRGKKTISAAKVSVPYIYAWDGIFRLVFCALFRTEETANSRKREFFRKIPEFF